MATIETKTKWLLEAADLPTDIKNKELLKAFADKQVREGAYTSSPADSEKIKNSLGSESGKMKYARYAAAYLIWINRKVGVDLDNPDITSSCRSIVSLSKQINDSSYNPEVDGSHLADQPAPEALKKQLGNKILGGWIGGLGALFVFTENAHSWFESFTLAASGMTNNQHCQTALRGLQKKLTTHWPKISAHLLICVDNPTRCAEKVVRKN